MRALTALVLATALAGCEKQAKPAAPAPRPDALVVDFSRPTAAADDGLRAFATAVNPTAGMLLDDEMVLHAAVDGTGFSGLDALDRAAPVHLLVVEGGSGEGVVLVAKVKDAKQLAANKGSAAVETRHGWAVIGKAADVHAVAAYALSKLAGAPVPPQPTAIVYLPRLLAAHAAELAAARAQMTAAPGMSGDMTLFLDGYIDGLSSIAHDTDELRLTIDATAERAVLDAAFSPHPGSRLAAFVAAQHASDFHLLGALPEQPAGVLFAGHVALGPYHAGVVDVLVRLYHAAGIDLGTSFAALAGALDGEVAAVGQLQPGAGMAMTQVAGLSDRAAAESALADLHAALASGAKLDLGAIQATYKALPATDHDGVRLLPFDTTYDASRAPPSMRAGLAITAPRGVQHTVLGIVDKQLIVSMSTDPQVAGRAVDVVHGKAPALALPPPIAALVASARARKDNAVMVFDLGAMMAMYGRAASTAPISLALGSEHGALHLQVEVPAGSIQSLRPH